MLLANHFASGDVDQFLVEWHRFKYDLIDFKGVGYEPVTAIKRRIISNHNYFVHCKLQLLQFFFSLNFSRTWIFLWDSFTSLRNSIHCCLMSQAFATRHLWRMLGQRGAFLLSNKSRQGIFIVVLSFSVWGNGDIFFLFFCDKSVLHILGSVACSKMTC